MPRRSGDRPRRMKVATISVHAGTPEGPNAPITTPVVQSTTFRFESAEAVQRYARGEGGLYMYSRDENPTVRAAEDAVAALEGADSCVLFGSGMGAPAAPPPGPGPRGGGGGGGARPLRGPGTQRRG